jgi:hypothetical protein
MKESIPTPREQWVIDNVTRWAVPYRHAGRTPWRQHSVATFEEALALMEQPGYARLVYAEANHPAEGVMRALLPKSLWPTPVAELASPGPTT